MQFFFISGLSAFWYSPITCSSWFTTGNLWIFILSIRTAASVDVRHVLLDLTYRKKKHTWKEKKRWDESKDYPSQFCQKIVWWLERSSLLRPLSLTVTSNRSVNKMDVLLSFRIKLATWCVCVCVICVWERGEERADPMSSSGPVILDDHPNTSEAAVYNWKPWHGLKVAFNLLQCLICCGH